MRTFTKALGPAVLAGATLFTLVGCTSDGHDHALHSHGAAAKPYLLATCIVSDDAFDHGEPVVFVHNGQEIKLCCKDCRKDFDKDPAKYLSKLGAAKPSAGHH
jgi:hypothetical protein